MVFDLFFYCATVKTICCLPVPPALLYPGRNCPIPNAIPVSVAATNKEYFYFTLDGMRTDPWQCFPISTEDYIQLCQLSLLLYAWTREGDGRMGGGGVGGQCENNLDRGAGGAGGHMGVQTEGFTLFSQFPKEKS